MSDEDDGLLDALTGIVAVATLPAGILAGIFLGGQAAAIVFVVGWLLLVPVLGILSDHVGLGSGTDVDSEERTSTEDRPEGDALRRLRERYAAGEIDEAEFERRLEALLETEDLDVPTGAGRRSGSTDRDRESELE